MLTQEELCSRLEMADVDQLKPQCFFSKMIQFIMDDTSYSCSNIPSNPLMPCEECSKNNVTFYCTLDQC